MLQAFVGNCSNPIDVVNALLDVPSALTDGCLTLYGDVVYGGWNGKYPSREQCVRLTCTVNPLRVRDEDAKAEFERVLRVVFGDPLSKMYIGSAFIPVYEVQSIVTNALDQKN